MDDIGDLGIALERAHETRSLLSDAYRKLRRIKARDSRFGTPYLAALGALETAYREVGHFMDEIERDDGETGEKN